MWQLFSSLTSMYSKHIHTPRPETTHNTTQQHNTTTRHARPDDARARLLENGVALPSRAEGEPPSPPRAVRTSRSSRAASLATRARQRGRQRRRKDSRSPHARCDLFLRAPFLTIRLDDARATVASSFFSLREKRRHPVDAPRRHTIARSPRHPGSLKPHLDDTPLSTAARGA